MLDPEVVMVEMFDAAHAGREHDFLRASDVLAGWLAAGGHRPRGVHLLNTLTRRREEIEQQRRLAGTARLFTLEVQSPAECTEQIVRYHAGIMAIRSFPDHEDDVSNEQLDATYITLRDASGRELELDF